LDDFDNMAAEKMALGNMAAGKMAFGNVRVGTGTRHPSCHPPSARHDHYQTFVFSIRGHRHHDVFSIRSHRHPGASSDGASIIVFPSPNE
jgi:hypothetical protein